MEHAYYLGEDGAGSHLLVVQRCSAGRDLVEM
jgi:hypothetical protein